jgi:hypothetical protein
VELGGRLLDQGATLAAPTLGSTVRSGMAARPDRCRADTCRWMEPLFLFCDRSAGGAKGPLGATGRGNLRTLCPARLSVRYRSEPALARCPDRRLGWEGHSPRESRHLPGTLWWSPTTAFAATNPTVHSHSSGGGVLKGCTLRGKRLGSLNVQALPNRPLHPC